MLIVYLRFLVNLVHALEYFSATRTTCTPRHVGPTSCISTSKSLNLHVQMDMHTAFPIEVFEAIIDQARAHRPSLFQISLSSRIFLPRTRHHIYFHIKIACKDKLESMTAFLLERPWLPPLVGSVTVMGSKDRSSCMLLEVVPMPLFTQLPNLRTVELARDLSQGESPPPYLFSPSLRTLSALRKLSASIRHLKLAKLQFQSADAFMRLFYAFPCLESLTCAPWGRLREHRIDSWTGRALLRNNACHLIRLTVCQFTV